MEEELEILESIYYDDIIKKDLTGDKPFFEIFLYPTSTDNQEENNKLIKLNLITYFPQNYPEDIPSFEFNDAKGITDEDLKSIKKEVETLANNIQGEPMLFEIIQFIKDKLSEFGNLPTTYKCSICLNSFEESINTYNLHCYHYFHIECLKKHLSYMEEEIEKEKKEAELNRLTWEKRVPTCPDCRSNLINSEIEYFQNIKLKKDKDDLYYKKNVFISDSVRKMQEKMKIIFEKQKNAGGIIDETKQEIIMITRSEHEDVNNTEISNNQ